MAENFRPKKTDRSLALFAYVWALVLIPLLAWGKDDFIHFHARQGLILFLCECALMILAVVVPVFGPLLIFPLGLVFSVVLSLFGLLNVLGGRHEKLPLIGRWADKIKLS